MSFEAESTDNSNGQESNGSMKLFVGGLSKDTKHQDLRDYFSTFGEIAYVNAKTDKMTGNCRGFGFVMFTSADSINKVFAVEEHSIKNQKVDVQRPKVKPGKIFVGGLTAQMSDDDIKDHFSTFGKIIETQMPFDKTKQQRKGFCFITFEDQEVIRTIMKNPKQIIKDKEVEVKKPNPKPEDGGFRGGYGDGGFDDSQGGYGYDGGFDQGGYGGGYFSSNQAGGFQQNRGFSSFNNGSNNRGRGSFRGNQRGAPRGGGRGRFQPY